MQNRACPECREEIGGFQPYNNSSVSALDDFISRLLINQTSVELIQDNPINTNVPSRIRGASTATRTKTRRFCIVEHDTATARQSFSGTSSSSTSSLHPLDNRMFLLEDGLRWESEPMDSSSDHSNGSARMRLPCDKPRLPKRRQSPILDEAEIDQILGC